MNLFKGFMGNIFLSIFKKRNVVFSVLLFFTVAGFFLGSANPVSAEACDAGTWGGSNVDQCGVGKRCVPDSNWGWSTWGSGLVGIYRAGTCRTVPIEPSICDAAFVGEGFCFISKLPAVVAVSITVGLNALSKNILNGILDFLLTSISYTGSRVVLAGWPIVRDFANILIVIGFIGIALATILRWPAEYDAKTTKILPKLIIAALLVNFSLVICGVMVDVANITIKFFVMGTARDNIGDALTTIGNYWEKLEDRGISPLNMLMDAISLIITSLLSAATRGLFIFLFLFRIIAIWLLVILSPLAFICYVFPATKKVWDIWWSNFSQWLIIGIPGAFFLFLAEKLQGFEITTPALTEQGRATILVQGFNTIFGELVPGLFLVIGFLFSLQISAMGGNMATGAARWVGGKAKDGTKWAGKWAADNTGVTRAKDATVYGLTRVGESLRLVNRGQAQANWNKSQRGTAVDDAARKDRTDNMTFEQKAANLRGGAITNEGHLDNAAILKSLSKEEMSRFSHGEQMQYLEKYQTYGAKPSEIVDKMSTLNQNQIVAGVPGLQISAKTRGEALKALAAKKQLDPSVAGALTEGQITTAIDEMMANGMDPKDVINALEGVNMANMVRNGEFDAPTRAKILKALAEKRQLDLMTQGEQIAAMVEAQDNGVKAQDIVGKASSDTQAHIIENDLFNPETQARAVESLMKKNKLDAIPEVHRDRAYARAVANGVDAEELEGKDYRAGAHNKARLERLGAPTGITPIMIEDATAGDAAVATGRAATPAQATAMAAVAPIRDEARDEVLDEDIGSMNGDKLRDINFGDITFERVARLTQDKIRQFQRAPDDSRRQLRLYINPGLTPATPGAGLDRRFELDREILHQEGERNRFRTTDPAQAQIHATEGNRLIQIRRTIGNLPVPP